MEKHEIPVEKHRKSWRKDAETMVRCCEIMEDMEKIALKAPSCSLKTWETMGTYCENVWKNEGKMMGKQ